MSPSLVRLSQVPNQKRQHVFLGSRLGLRRWLEESISTTTSTGGSKRGMDVLSGASLIAGLLGWVSRGMDPSIHCAQRSSGIHDAKLKVGSFFLSFLSHNSKIGGPAGSWRKIGVREMERDESGHGTNTMMRSLRWMDGPSRGAMPLPITRDQARGLVPASHERQMEAKRM